MLKIYWNKGVLRYTSQHMALNLPVCRVYLRNLYKDNRTIIQQSVIVQMISPEFNVNIGWWLIWSSYSTKVINALVELPIDPPGKGQIWIIFSLFYDGSSLYIEGGGLNGARSIYFVSYWDNHPSFTSHYVLELYSHVCTHYGAFLHPDMKLFKSVFYRILLYNTISWAFDNRRFRLLSVQIH